MILTTIVNRKTGEVTRKIDPTPVEIDYKPLGKYLAQEFIEWLQSKSKSEQINNSQQ